MKASYLLINYCGKLQMILKSDISLTAKTVLRFNSVPSQQLLIIDYLIPRNNENYEINFLFFAIELTITFPFLTLYNNLIIFLT